MRLLHRWDVRLFVALLAISLLITSGRFGGADPGAQFDVATLLVSDGELSTPAPISDLWLQGHDGRYYEVHDIGNVLLMLPAAVAGKLTGTLRLEAPPDAIRLLVAFTYALLAAICLTFFTRGAISILESRRSGLMALGLLGTTTYLAYQKTAYDVLGAMLFTAAAVYPLSKLLQRDRIEHVGGWAMMLGLAIGAAGCFRATWAPFALLGVGFAAFASRKREEARPLALALTGGCLIALVPEFIYNVVRSGNPLHVLASEYYASALDPGRILEGLWFFLLSPKKGLIVYTPFLLVGVAALIKMRLRVPVWATGCLVSTASFVIFLALQPNREGALGPRYLLPALPLLALAAAPAVAASWRGRRTRAIVGLLVSLTLLVNVPAVLTAWNDDIVELRPTSAQTVSAGSFAPIRAIYAGLLVGATGQDRYESGYFRPIASTTDQVFPDLWWRQAMHRGGATGIGGAASALLLLIIAVAAVRGLRAASQEVGGSRENGLAR